MSATPKYLMDADKKDKFVSILLLDYVLTKHGKLPVLVEKPENQDFQVLEPLLIKMVAKGLLAVSGQYYTPTEKGKQALINHKQRYADYLKMFDLYCSVDLKTGEFAFAKILDEDMKDDDTWNEYLNQERWEDCRVAVAEYKKKIDPLEIVFMSFVSEGRFDTEEQGWQFSAYSGLVWTEAVTIANHALSVDQINQGDPEVMQNLVDAGSKLAVSLIKTQADAVAAENKAQAEYDAEQEQNASIDRQNQQLNQQQSTIVEESSYYDSDTYTYPYTYYEPYYEPYYVDPIWVLLFW